ncbi:hypothetical protein PSTG_09260 [Puccinia striiformis f. sp. tritici PST-78]|uniref:Uncharacterized protein n=1 Tax=Puccinia striiformis f. sp. tritici PST-78 TaxID=1165861 RepID=A0A0L0VDP1_9BASI|nr:hypothetical protein PSTG_09260 [Puccinia striiformis f. sp. tritici PST-78]
MRVIADGEIGKDELSPFVNNNRSLPDVVHQKNLSLLNRISTQEKQTESEQYNQQKQDSQLRNHIV